MGPARSQARGLRNQVRAARPKLKETADFLAGSVNKSKAIAAVNQLNELLRQPGYSAMFCSTVTKDLGQLKW
jgi:hypothetical protein